MSFSSEDDDYSTYRCGSSYAAHEGCQDFDNRDEEVCNCFEDLCNAADGKMAAHTVVMSGLAFLAAKYFA